MKCTPAGDMRRDRLDHRLLDRADIGHRRARLQMRARSRPRPRPSRPPAPPAPPDRRPHRLGRAVGHAVAPARSQRAARVSGCGHSPRSRRQPARPHGMRHRARRSAPDRSGRRDHRSPSSAALRPFGHELADDMGHRRQEASSPTVMRRQLRQAVAGHPPHDQPLRLQASSQASASSGPAKRARMKFAQDVSEGTPFSPAPRPASCAHAGILGRTARVMVAVAHGGLGGLQLGGSTG
jgi:hypothetical protein